MTDLDARYGRTPRRSARGARIGTAAGVAALTLGVAGIWWVSAQPTGPNLQARDLGYVVGDDSHASVAFEVSVDPGTPVRCALQALDPGYGIVGWRVVDLPPSDTLQTAHTVELRTTVRATTGLVSECWVT